MMRLGSLFSGYGGLELGIAQVLDVEPAWHSEIDPAACKVLAHHWPDVPNLGDITAIDWATVEPIDILTGGWPCQPFSLAGKQKGASDARALWPYVADAVRTLRPRLVVLENVAAIASAGELGRAVGDLAALGYVGSWSCLRAADVGAAHGRARVFIAAADANSGSVWEQPVSISGRSGSPIAGHAGAALAPNTTGVGHERHGVAWGWRDGSTDRDHSASHADGPRLRERWRSVADAAELAAAELDRPDAPTDTLGGGRDGRTPVALRETVGRAPTARSGEVDWREYGPAVRRWERLTRRAPSPTLLSTKGNPRLSGRFTEWLMGLPDGWITDVPGISNNDALKLCGNGVVPQQATAALRINLDRMAAA